MVFTMTIAGSSPAEAQGSSFSAGYQVTRVPDLTYPLGWYVDAAVPVAPSLSGVGEVSGAYKSQDDFGVDLTARLHTFMAGVRFTNATATNMAPFGQVLIGAARGSGSVSGFGVSVGGSGTEFAFQVGGGVNVMTSDRMGFRLGADYRHAGENMFRFNIGIVLPFGS
jgi:opacity protein-like surface antigen